ncbi:Carboxypeptidase A6 [Dissostichus eleginoides]|uniref:Carboxypeptidase A6 n=1 Tax=Dissostichus eleginoides TaxID=100907 RepID=A0AAD9ENF3_DISEL|nr:Carboxypeptidase A6 [Dissostichus eleginoides]
MSPVLIFFLCSSFVFPVGGFLYNNRYSGITPREEREVKLLQSILGHMKVDLWQPNSAALICLNNTVDAHVKRNDTRRLHTHLQRENIDYRVFISDLQREIQKQTGSRSSRKRRSETQYDYEVYHSLDEVHTHTHTDTHTHTHTHSNNYPSQTLHSCTQFTLKVCC